MTNFLSIENIAIQILGYDISYLELVGTILNLISVILVARRNIWTWPIGIVAVVLFFFLFYQARLYSDMFEQVYFFITCIWGWWAWAKHIPKDGTPLNVGFSNRLHLLRDFVTMLVISGLLGIFMSRIHVVLPGFFPYPADFPYLDALTTIASFLATLLMIQRRTECWIYWISVDIVGIGLYASKGLPMLAILYGIFLVLASYGLFLWLQTGGKPAPSTVYT